MDMNRESGSDELNFTQFAHCLPLRKLWTVKIIPGNILTTLNPTDSRCTDIETILLINVVANILWFSTNYLTDSIDSIFLYNAILVVSNGYRNGCFIKKLKFLKPA